ncbi:hypothetical protein BJX64DRAFT_251709, partial [Aspergillus heterothallicus]
MITGFTALFAISVVIMTNARRADVFAATAAYAAVLVVFISENLLYKSFVVCWIVSQLDTLSSVMHIKYILVLAY